MDIFETIEELNSLDEASQISLKSDNAKTKMIGGLRVVDFPILKKEDYNPEDDIYDELYGKEAKEVLEKRGIYYGSL